VPYRHNYPATVAEILDDGMAFKSAVPRAVRAFARKRPYRLARLGTTGSRNRLTEAVIELYTELARIYGIRVPSVTTLWATGTSGSSCYRPALHSIELRGRFSVVTMLHEFDHARGRDERQAVKWSVNLFRRCFPRSFARCSQVGHTLVNERS